MKTLHLGNGRAFVWDGERFYCPRTYATPTSEEFDHLVRLLRDDPDSDSDELNRYLDGPLNQTKVRAGEIASGPHALDWIADEGGSLRRVGASGIRRILDRRPGQCTWCGRRVPGHRQTFCSRECVIEFEKRCDDRFLRHKVRHRDRGRCAECGVDTLALQQQLEDEPDNEQLREELIRQGFDLETCLWEMDHIVPVSQGGGLCDLDGLQTLCAPCHKRKSAQR